MQQASLQAIFQWDVRNWSKALALWDAFLPKAEGATALALGEREGGLSIWLAQKGYEVTCTDLSDPRSKASALHVAHGLADRISYAAVDATDIQLPGPFDVVIFKSMIGALGSKEKQVQAISEMYRVLKPGGVLLFAENLAGSALHRWSRSRFVSWSSYWRYLDLRIDRDLFAEFDRVELRTCGFLAAFGRSEAQRQFLGRVDGLIDPLVPASWRYILFGACKKAR